ncbi:uncharacterized protein LOC129969549 [Argiope bruennichi]|uniref:uncharacterized protein LOC129969549 n=1 Tax=Argiope bruennichi TaxID=94029 RepID=UPI002494F4DD|nr:uncharacterized protein LOC129969549 [Argiope bruennichi]
MHSPIPHDLTIYNKIGFDFQKHGFCPHQWEISVPQKNCIIWGVVLSYLRTADFIVPGNFEERLRRLTENTCDPEEAKLAVLNFNPFFNIHKCFFDQILQKVSLSFKKILNENRPTAASKNARQDIQIISTLLKSNILIVDITEQNLHLVTPSNSHCADVAAITLICKEYPSKESKQPMKRFTFSLSKDLCWELRRTALQIFLESPEIRGVTEQLIEPLIEKKEKKVNILIALLKKNLIREVNELYDSSHSMVKLADAGFETDPTVPDADGFSAFYYALQSDDNNLVYILYRYAANSCFKFENTFRDPNPLIISNFSKLKEILDGDCAKSNNFEKLGDKEEQVRLKCEDLQKFNEFLTRVSRGLNDIRKQPESSSMEKAVKQKDVILHILDTYNAFFLVGQSGSEVENYTRHKTYYDNLDLTVALLFFDNIFLLKSVLKSPEERLYSKLESSFLLSAVTNKNFNFDAKNCQTLRDLGIELFSTNLFILPFLERHNLREQVTNFCSIIREKKPRKKDIVKCIPQQEIDVMLSCFLELKDEFLIFRLNHYLKTALETKPKGLKQKFAIERALQVIGESLNVRGEDPSSIRHLLCKCLPDDTLEILKKTRNTLSHLKSFQFPFKFEAELDDSLFESIQSEIRNMKALFEEIFPVQKIRLLEFLIHRGLESVKKFPQYTCNVEQTLVQRMENFREVRELKDTSDGKGNCLSVPAIKEFCRNLMGFASVVQRKKILEEISSEVTTRVVALKKLKEDIESGISVDLNRFDNLFLKAKSVQSIKNFCKEYLEMEEDSEAKARLKVEHKKSLLHKIKESPNPSNILERIFEKKKVSGSQLKFLYKTIDFSNETKSTLNSLIETSKCPCGDSLENLLNRINYLYQISIDEQFDIRFLWERAKSPQAKRYLVYKIVQRYFREPSFQASLEMLLFDCIAILKQNEDFKSFWLKDSFLFNGIDVRNVLAHGDPLLESVGDLLDPKDFASELVKKMLQLINDRDSIEALSDLWKKATESGVIPENSPECCKLKECIVRCERWKDYSKLLAEDPNVPCQKIVLFLNKTVETKKKKGNS